MNNIKFNLPAGAFRQNRQNIFCLYLTAYPKLCRTYTLTRGHIRLGLGTNKVITSDGILTWRCQNVNVKH